MGKSHGPSLAGETHVTLTPKPREPASRVGEAPPPPTLTWPVTPRAAPELLPQPDTWQENSRRNCECPQVDPLQLSRKQRLPASRPHVRSGRTAGFTQGPHALSARCRLPAAASVSPAEEFLAWDHRGPPLSSTQGCHGGQAFELRVTPVKQSEGMALAKGPLSLAHMPL